jgi:hypothetical protein
MRVQQAQMQAAQGDRLAVMASRGTAWHDEVDDMRVAGHLCNHVANAHALDSIGTRVRSLAAWIRIATIAFEHGCPEVRMPEELREALRDVGEELRDSAESELDRLALAHLKRMLRRHHASHRDEWALRRVLELVDQEGFVCLEQDAHALRTLRGVLHGERNPVQISASVEAEIRQVLSEFSS